uniref:Uncharacterized protein n=1 Tax=Branchiostoma floridae TaxID=7739 RepID=C3Z5I1_BRAFL|eukprot:XP_002596082.1 hypothetical protein BRAFLDRAFT_66186 [Branchiostoma floridae]
MAKIFLLLVVAVMTCVGEGKPLKKSNPSPNGYVILTKEEADRISPMLKLQVHRVRREIRRVSKRTGVPCRVVKDRKPDRIPRGIPVADRLSSECNNGSGVTGYAKASWPVIWKVTVDGELQHRFQQERFPVACVCMRPRTAPPG